MCPRESRRQTYYDILGIPTGASINHLKDSYRLLTKKNPITDAAYEILTDSQKRREYNAQLICEFQPTAHTQSPRTEGYQRVDSSTVAANRSVALASLKEHGFRDCTSQVENA